MNFFKLNKNIVYFITATFLLVVAYFCSQIHLHEQEGLKGGLILSKKIIYPDNIAPYKDYLLGAWTSIHQISALLFKFNWSVANVNKFFIFIIALLYMIGIISITQSLTKSSLIAVLMTLTVVIFQKNFGDADYPTLFFTPHTYGALSLAITTLIFGLVFLGNLFWVGFFSICTISVHPVVGLWTTSVIIFSLVCFKFYLNEEIKLKSYIYGITLGIFVTLLSFFIYFDQSYFFNLETDMDALNSYIKNWDHHRANAVFHLDYLFKTTILFLISVFYLVKFRSSSNKYVRLGVFAVIISILFSSIIYIAYKIINFPVWLTLIMPSRFIIMHSVIGWPLILGILFVAIKVYLKKRNFSNYWAPTLIISILLIYTIQHNSTLISLKNYYIQNTNLGSTLSKNDYFWDHVRKNSLKGYTLTSKSTGDKTFTKGLKPILLHPGRLDFVPYLPHTAGRTARIIEEIYGISFTNPPLEIKNQASINDEIIKLNFEKYSNYKWVELSKKYNISTLVVPVEWNINLQPIFQSNEFAFYILQR